MDSKDILKSEYFHFGTDIIKRELWLDVFFTECYSNYTKPIGGLWCSKRNKDYLCDWLEYKKEKNSEMFLYYFDHINSCLIKFKNNSKLLSITNNNDYKNLKDSGFVKKLHEPMKLTNEYDYFYIDEIPDYNKISVDYDILYVEPFFSKIFYQFSIDTVLAMNIDCIEYYKSLVCDYENNIILRESEKKKIEKIDNCFLKLYEVLESKFKNKNFSDQKEMDEFRKHILYTLKNDINLLKLIKKDLSSDEVLKTSLNNIANKLSKKMILHK